MNKRLMSTGRRVLAGMRQVCRLPRAAELPASFVSLLADPAELMDEAWSALLREPTAAAPVAEKSVAESDPARSHATLPRMGRNAASRNQFSPFAQTGHEEKERNAAAADEDISEIPLTARDAALHSMPSSSASRRNRYKGGNLETRGARVTASRQDGLATAETRSNIRPHLAEQPATERHTASPIPIVLKPPKLHRAASVMPQSSAVAEPSGSRRNYHEDETLESRLVRLITSQQDGLATAETRSNVLAQSAEQPATESDTASSIPIVLKPPNLHRAASVVSELSTARDETPKREQPDTETRTRLTRNATRLAAVLNANLLTEAMPSQVQASLLSQASMVQASLAQASLASPSPIALPRLTSAEQQTSPPAEATALNAPTIEAILAALYERLRVEFLRTYGTSGD
ncbi:MAG TPA: hypothetical protein VJZ26_14560 [Blastocatellia bacterium]|nr:hypothetical protein [Blastocatellia bacterium]